MIVSESFSIFLFGGYGEFDSLCHCAVSKLKNKYPFIQRVYCYSDEKQYAKSKIKGEILLADYEKFEMLPLDFDYWYTRIYFRNCKMVDLSDLVIFYAKAVTGSGAYKILRYAEKSKKRLINLL